MPLVVLLLNLLIISAPQAQATQSGMPKEVVKGLRVDPGYFYSDFQGLTDPIRIARALVADVKAAGVNTLFVYTYNPVYGAYYPTAHAYTAVERGLGQVDIIGALIRESKRAGIRVVATFPVDTFKHAWDANPKWRSRHRDGSDYRPLADVYPLSVGLPEVRSWYRGLIQDFIGRYPGISGIEAHEGFVDYHWRLEADFNGVDEGTSEEQFRRQRAAAFTSMVLVLCEEAKRARKPSYVVQTWTSDSTGQLMPSSVIAENSGFDFNALLTAPAAVRPQFVMAELNWQQWRSEYGSDAFSPQWTERAGKEFVKLVGDAALPLVHVELSKFDGSNQTSEPTLDEFRESLRAAFATGVGVDVYDYHQLRTRNALHILGEVYTQH